MDRPRIVPPDDEPVPPLPADAAASTVLCRVARVSARVDDAVLVQTLAAIATVWWRHEGARALAVDVVVADRFERRVPGEGEQSCCIPAARQIRLAVGQLARWGDCIGLPLEATLLLAAAHEARHLVQHERGRLPTTGTTTGAWYAGGGGGVAGEIEREANDTAARLLAAYLPGARGVLELGHGDRVYVPEAGCYAELWPRVPFDVELVPLAAIDVALVGRGGTVAPGR